VVKKRSFTRQQSLRHAVSVCLKASGYCRPSLACRVLREKGRHGIMSNQGEKAKQRERERECGWGGKTKKTKKKKKPVQEYGQEEWRR